MAKGVKLLALIDGDILAYRSAAACAKKTYRYTHKKNKSLPMLEFSYVAEAREALGDKLQDYNRCCTTVTSPPEHCLYSLRHTLRSMIEDTHSQECKIFLGGEGNFRDGLTADYKAGRAEKPQYLKLARDYLIEFFGAEVVNGQEVDDRLAQEQSYDSVICSIDKDLLQVPGAHWNWITKDWVYITKQEGDEWFWAQMLTGDGVDNITGIAGVGPIIASQLLDIFDKDRKQMRGFVQGMYLEEFGHTHGMKKFFLNTKLLYIRRREEHVTTGAIMQEVS